MPIILGIVKRYNDLIMRYATVDGQVMQHVIPAPHNHSRVTAHRYAMDYVKSMRIIAGWTK